MRLRTAKFSGQNQTLRKPARLRRAAQNRV